MITEQAQPKDTSKQAVTPKNSKGSLAVVFWGFLVGGSIGWIAAYLILGFLFVMLPDEPSEVVAGSLLLIISAIFYLWGFVFSGLSIGAAYRYQGRALWKWLTYIVCSVYILMLMVMLVVLVHVSTIV